MRDSHNLAFADFNLIPDAMVRAAAAPDQGEDDDVVLLALVVVHHGDG